MGYNLRKNPTSSHKKDYIYDCRKTTIVKSKTKINVMEFVKTVIAKANESGESTIVETVKIIKANQFRKTRVEGHAVVSSTYYCQETKEIIASSRIMRTFKESALRITADSSPARLNTFFIQRRQFIKVFADEERRIADVRRT